MKIDQVSIESFSQTEYQPVHIRDLDGENLLIFGNNRTGKTLTFNALIYNILGPEYTQNVPIGHGNSVSVDFTNKIEFFRGETGATFRSNRAELTGEEAQEAFIENLVDTVSNEIEQQKVILTHFLGSDSDLLPLNSFSYSEIISIINGVVNEGTQQKIESLSNDIDMVDEDIKEIESDLEELKYEKSQTKRAQSSAKSELTKYENLLDLHESGDLKSIIERLQNDQQTKQKLEDLYKERRHLGEQLESINKQIGRWERYEQESIYSVIAKATHDFVCPVCEGRVGQEKAENRLSNGYCPFCHEDHQLRELKDNIGSKIETSPEELSNLKKEKSDIQQRREELENRIEQLEDDELDNLDEFVELKLRQHDFAEKSLTKECEKEIADNRQAIKESEEQLEEINETIASLENKLSDLRSSKKKMQKEIQSIREKEVVSSLNDFSDTWSKNFLEIGGELGAEVRINQEEEVIDLPGLEDSREYPESLSSSEEKLLNLSFAVTLNQYLVDQSLSAWQTIVLDEPFIGIQEKHRSSPISFMRNSNIQFIITSSDQRLKNRFEEQKSLTGYSQTSLRQFDGDDDG